MDRRRQRIRRKLLLAIFLLLPVTLNYYSPYLMTTGAAEGVVTFSMLFWLGLLVTAPFVGRVFCGWACPFHGLQLAWDAVRVKPLKRVRGVRWVKYALWGAWVLGVGAALASAGGFGSTDLLYMTESGISVTDPGNYVTYFGLVGLTLAASGFGRRGFCHYLCPFGVWSIVGVKLSYLLKLPSVRLNPNSSACESCERCQRACPMSLPVTEMVRGGDMHHTECILCGTCVDTCPNSSIRWSIGPR